MIAHLPVAAHDDNAGAVCPSGQELQDRPAFEPRHSQIEEDDRRLPLLGDANRLLAVHSQEDLVTAAVKVALQGPSNKVVVIDDEDQFVAIRPGRVTVE